MTLVAVAVFNQAISAFATDRGWDQFFISGWSIITDFGWASLVVFAFFSLGGATLALWIEAWFRAKWDNKAELSKVALSCTASLTFTKSESGELAVSLGAQSENVRHYAWYLNNGGTMRNAAVLIFVEFEKEIPLPEVFAHCASKDGEWREIASTNRWMFTDLKGWPEGEVVLQALDSKALGLERRAELMVWRSYGPV